MKIVLDTNVFVSYILHSSRGPKGVWDLVRTKKVDLVLSLEIVEEVQATLRKPRLQKFIHPERRDEVLSLLSTLVNTPITVTVDLVRDIDDNKIVATAISGRAAYLVTHDDDLLKLDQKHQAELKQKYGISIVSAHQFMKDVSIAD